MDELQASVIDDFSNVAYHVVAEVKGFFELWKSGKVYIPRGALKAMGWRYLALRDAPVLTTPQVHEFARLYAFFCLLYPPDGDIPSIAGMAIDYCNLLTLRELSPTPSTDVLLMSQNVPVSLLSSRF